MIQAIVVAEPDWTTTPEDFASRRFLIIGQAPARSATPEMRPWDSASGKRLARYMAVPSETILHQFDTTNLNRGLYELKGKWDGFEMSEARARAAKLKDHLHQWQGVLICGKRVAQLMGYPLLDWVVEGHTTIGAIPHPGGTNKWWNDPHHREKAIDYLSVVREDWLRG